MESAPPIPALLGLVAHGSQLARISLLEACALVRRRLSPGVYTSMVTSADSAASLSVQVTAAAFKFIQRMVRFGAAGAPAGFRLEVSAGGCSGMSSQFSIESAPKSGDRVVALADGMQLFLPPLSYALLEGVTIDFVESATEARLAFIDPKAQSCGCGSSSSEPKVTRLR